MQTLVKQPFLKHSTIITLVLANAILESSLWPITTGNRPHSPVGWQSRELPWSSWTAVWGHGLAHQGTGTSLECLGDVQPTTQEDTVPSSGPSVTTWGTAAWTIGPGASPAYQHAHNVHLATREEGYFSGDQRRVPWWTPLDISYIRYFFKTGKCSQPTYLIHRNKQRIGKNEEIDEYVINKRTRHNLRNLNCSKK